jgi:hypothetical protein
MRSYARHVRSDKNPTTDLDATCQPDGLRQIIRDVPAADRDLMGRRLAVRVRNLRKHPLLQLVAPTVAALGQFLERRTLGAALAGLLLLRRREGRGPLYAARVPWRGSCLPLGQGIRSMLL